MNYRIQKSLNINKTIRSVLKVVVLALINKKTDKELVASSWKNRD